MPDDGTSGHSKRIGDSPLRQPAHAAQKADTLASGHPVKVSIEFYPEHRGLLVAYFLNPRGRAPRWRRALSRSRSGISRAGDSCRVLPGKEASVLPVGLGAILRVHGTSVVVPRNRRADARNFNPIRICHMPLSVAGQRYTYSSARGYRSVAPGHQSMANLRPGSRGTRDLERDHGHVTSVNFM